MLENQFEAVRSIVQLDVPDAVLEERICGRWMHKESGRSYHAKFAPPKSFPGGDAEPSVENMKDDETGEDLYQRGDDTKEALAKRLEGYHGQTVPILAHYEANDLLVKVDANRDPKLVREEIIERVPA